MYHVTTGAHDDNATWYRSLLDYTNNDECPEPAAVFATILRGVPDNEEVSQSNIIRAIERAMITNRRQRRPTTTVRRNAVEDIVSFVEPAQADDQDRYLGYQPDPNCVTPLRNLWRSLNSFFTMLDTSPQRTAVSPGISVTSMTDITAQISVELGDSHPEPLHQRGMSMIDSERGMFNSNLDRHVSAFPPVNTSCSSSSQLNPMEPTPWQMEQFSLLEGEGNKRRYSSYAEAKGETHDAFEDNILWLCTD